MCIRDSISIAPDSPVCIYIHSGSLIDFRNRVLNGLEVVFAANGHGVDHVCDSLQLAILALKFLFGECPHITGVAGGAEFAAFDGSVLVVGPLFKVVYVFILIVFGNNLYLKGTGREPAHGDHIVGSIAPRLIPVLCKPVRRQNTEMCIRDRYSTPWFLMREGLL